MKKKPLSLVDDPHAPAMSATVRWPALIPLVALHDRRLLLIFELQALGRRMQRRIGPKATKGRTTVLVELCIGQRAIPRARSEEPALGLLAEAEAGIDETNKELEATSKELTRQRGLVKLMQDKLRESQTVLQSNSDTIKELGGKLAEAQKFSFRALVSGKGGY